MRYFPPNIAKTIGCEKENLPIVYFLILFDFDIFNKSRARIDTIRMDAWQLRAQDNQKITENFHEIFARFLSSLFFKSRSIEFLSGRKQNSSQLPSPPLTSRKTFRSSFSHSLSSPSFFRLSLERETKILQRRIIFVNKC